VLSDYVGPFVQALMWMSVAIAVGIAVSVVISWRRGHEHGALALVATVDSVVAVTMATFTTWFGRVLSARPTPAVDAGHLYLQDAWRASALGWAHGCVSMSAALTIMGLGTAAPEQLQAGIVFVPFLLGGLWLSVVLTQRQHFRRRLWRTLPPGQVLLPGQQVPPPVGAGA
jgi:hypothetical protein